MSSQEARKTRPAKGRRDNIPYTPQIVEGGDALIMSSNLFAINPKVVSKPEEIKDLIEAIEYICEKDGLMFFRKCK